MNRRLYTVVLEIYYVVYCMHTLIYTGGYKFKYHHNLKYNFQLKFVLAPRYIQEGRSLTALFQYEEHSRIGAYIDNQNKKLQYILFLIKLLWRGVDKSIDCAW